MPSKKNDPELQAKEVQTAESPPTTVAALGPIAPIRSDNDLLTKNAALCQLTATM